MTKPVKHPLLKQGDKIYLPLYAPDINVIFWYNNTEVSIMSHNGKATAKGIIAQSKPILDGIPVIETNETVLKPTKIIEVDKDFKIIKYA
jgi:hypothetical protein